MWRPWQKPSACASSFSLQGSSLWTPILKAILYSSSVLIQTVWCLLPDSWYLLKFILSSTSTILPHAPGWKTSPKNDGSLWPKRRVLNSSNHRTCGLVSKMHQACLDVPSDTEFCGEAAEQFSSEDSSIKVKCVKTPLQCLLKLPEGLLAVKQKCWFPFLEESSSL